MPRLSVTIITRDEAANIGAALSSVAWADEVVVVDSGSRDETVAIARQLGARVFVRDWPGYVVQKNWAAEQASNHWILSIDADERVPAALAEEIRAVLASEPACRGFRIARVSRYQGRWLRSTDWYPDYQLRLYDRRTACWSGKYVHEGVAVQGRVGRLRNDLEHLPFRDMADHLETIDRYSTLAARQMHEAGRRVTAPALVFRPLAAFLRNYVLRGGWRDGSLGLVVSVLNGYYVFLKFAKLWERQRARDA